MLTCENTLILIIDIQEKLVNMLKENTCSTNCEKLVKASNILNIETIITEQYPKGLGETITELKLANPNAKYFEKTTFSAFATETIKNEIINSKKKDIVLCGIETHICVIQTALELKAAGYNVYLVKDACGSRNLENYQTAINRMQNSQITITDIETTLFEFLRSSKHPNFKEVQALIK